MGEKIQQKNTIGLPLRISGNIAEIYSMDGERLLYTVNQQTGEFISFVGERQTIPLGEKIGRAYIQREIERMQQRRQ